MVLEFATRTPSCMAGSIELPFAAALDVSTRPSFFSQCEDVMYRVCEVEDRKTNASRKHVTVHGSSLAANGQRRGRAGPARRQGGPHSFDSLPLFRRPEPGPSFHYSFILSAKSSSSCQAYYLAS